MEYNNIKYKITSDFLDKVWYVLDNRIDVKIKNVGYRELYKKVDNDILNKIQLEIRTLIRRNTL